MAEQEEKELVIQVQELAVFFSLVRQLQHLGPQERQGVAVAAVQSQTSGQVVLAVPVVLAGLRRHVGLRPQAEQRGRVEVVEVEVVSLAGQQVLAMLAERMVAAEVVAALIKSTLFMG
jgi:hypothetical protein